MSLVLPPIVFAFYDTSLGAGRLSGDWVPDIKREIAGFPEAKGPVQVYNLGHGGWTSNDLLNGAGLLTALKPTHICAEGGAINDCFDGGSGPAVSLSTHNANDTAMINQWRAGIPGVDITLMSMSSVAAYQTGRTALPTYYTAEQTLAASLGCGFVDNYNGTVTVPGGWPKPFDGLLTNGATPFLLPVTAGFGSLGGGNIFNPATSGSAMSFSSDDLTITSTTGGYATSRTLYPITSSVHFEMKVLQSNSLVGLATASTSLNDFLGDGGGNSLGWNPSGGLEVNGASIGTTFGYSSGSTIGIEVDPVGKLAYFLVGSSRSSGFDISGITGTLYPAATVYAGPASPGSVNGAGLSNQGDGLHPLKTPVDTYLKPNMEAYVRSKMGVYLPWQ